MIIGVNAIAITLGSPEHVRPILSRLNAEQIGSTNAWAIGNMLLEIEIEEQRDRLAPAPKVHEAGLTHLCLQSRDAPALKADLERGATRFNSDLTTLGNGTWYAYGTTPGGFVVEVESAEYAPQHAPGAWLSHVAYCTHDLERLANFYATLTGRPWFGGYRVRRNPANDAITGLADVDLKVCWVACGNILLEFWQYLNPETQARQSDDRTQAGIRKVVFEVDDLDAAASHLAASGVVFTGERIDEPDGSSRLEAVDPDGNAIAFASFARAVDDPRSLRRQPNFALMADLNDIRANLTTSSFRPRLQW